jgi:enoyl-[acyl-carrier-protein] reductase (NADH)
MGEDTTIHQLFAEHPAYAASFASLLPAVPVAQPSDLSDAVMYLASDLSRAVTGTQLTVDQGATKV